MRRLVAETSVEPRQLVLPMFVAEGLSEPRPISSMPGVVQHSRESARKAVAEAASLGLGGVMLFGVPEHKDATGSGGLDPDGILNVAIADARTEAGDDLLVMSDLCLDEFTDHGHCGVLDESGRVDNDATLEIYGRMGVAQAEAGAHLVGPSGMMDGQVGVIRSALDAAGHQDVGDPRLRREVRFRLLRPVPRSRRQLVAGRPAHLPAGPRQRPRGRARGPARRGGGRGHRHGQAGPRLPRPGGTGSRRRRPPRGRLQRLGRVRHGRGRRREGLDRPRARHRRVSAVDPACRRRHRAHLLGRGDRRAADVEVSQPKLSMQLSKLDCGANGNRKLH